MESKAKLLGHPIHPMLIPFPLGLLGGATAFDLIGYFTGRAGASLAAFWMIAAGIVSALVAAIFGAIDWVAIPAGTRAKRVGLLHGVGNVVVVLLFAVAWSLRLEEHRVTPGALLVLELLGFALAGVTGWMGGELVDRLGVGVDDGAHLNSPSSLSGRPAHDAAPAVGAVTGRAGSPRA